MSFVTRLFVIFALETSIATPSVAQATTKEQCVVSDFTRIEQKYILVTLGKEAAKYFTSSDKMKQQVANLTAEQVKGCVDNIPPVSSSATKNLLIATVLLSLGLSGLIIYSTLENAALGMMSETSPNPYKKIPQHTLVFLAIVLSIPGGR